jgi:hypothetical protein
VFNDTWAGIKLGPNDRVATLTLSRLPDDYTPPPMTPQDMERANRNLAEGHVRMMFMLAGVLRQIDVLRTNPDF